MENQKIMLWSEEEMQAAKGSSSAIGTFHSCQPSMTEHLAQTTEKRGTIIVCPGGGYARKADHEGVPIAQELNRQGIHAYVLDYRVHPDHHPSSYLDARRAIQIARKRAESNGAKTDRIGILGFSAGGHLAGLAGTMWNEPSVRPDVMVLCYPVISFGKFGHVNCRVNLLGEDASPTALSDLSIENRVDRQTPPTFIWHTADDEVVPVENTLLMASSLAQRKIPFSCHIYPHGKHGLGLAKNHPEIHQWFQECIHFLVELGF